MCVCFQDQADGSGKRRLDNGEVGRWKLTDDPPPKKKAPPSLEEGGRTTEGGHKRKKEKELPQDSGPKKKVDIRVFTVMAKEGDVFKLNCTSRDFELSFPVAAASQ